MDLLECILDSLSHSCFCSQTLIAGVICKLGFLWPSHQWICSLCLICHLYLMAGNGMLQIFALLPRDCFPPWLWFFFPHRTNLLLLLLLEKIPYPLRNSTTIVGKIVLFSQTIDCFDCDSDWIFCSFDLLLSMTILKVLLEFHLEEMNHSKKLFETAHAPFWWQGLCGFSFWKFP